MSTPHASEPDSARASHGRLHTRQIRAVDDRAGIVLALGGGFARGFAHLGVLEVLEQEQFPVSAIVGTSIGGLLGAAYADGISLRDLCDLGRRVRLRDFLRFEKSRPGTERRDCLGRFVQEWFHSRTVEELPIPTAIVTTDLQSCAPYVITQGPIEAAIRASCAFPGLFKPVEFMGRQLADGCVAAPVPTSVAAQMYGGCVLGVAVSSNTAIAASPETTLRSTLEPSWSRYADILLEPQVQEIAWNDFTRVDEAFAAGAEAMRRTLPRVRELLAFRAAAQSSLEMLVPPESGLAQ
jgi:NTE family protein